MAGYSGTPLERKLGIKDDVVFLDGAPEGLRLEARTTTRLPRTISLALTFHTHQKTLSRRLPQLIERLEPDGTLWVCWPKKAARKTPKKDGIESDLDENIVREAGLAGGVVDVKVAAIDDTWSGLKFVRRLKDR